MENPAMQDILCVFATLYLYSQYPNALLHRQEGKMRVMFGGKSGRGVESGSEREEGGVGSRAES